MTLNSGSISQVLGSYETKLHLKQQPEEVLLQVVEFPLEDKKHTWASLGSEESLNRAAQLTETLSFMLRKVLHRERRVEHGHPEAFLCRSVFLLVVVGFQDRI